MSDSDNSESDSYQQDSRTPCKYGDKCYQKNPAHHSQYKHPSKKSKRKDNLRIQSPKRLKLDKQFTDYLNDDNKNKESTTSSTARKKECISSSDSEQSDECSGLALRNKKRVEKHKENECISSSESEQNETAKQVGNNDENVDKTKEKLIPPLSVEEQNSFEITEKDDSKLKPFDAKTFIKTRFLVDMPEDFFKFWEFCKQLSPSSPGEALKNVGLKLVGPYDVLAGKFRNCKESPEDYLLHWRYYYDVPEVFTVIKGDDKTGYHIGYFYDCPNEAPSFLVSNHGTKDGVFSKMGDNIFTAVSLYLEELKKVGDPFKKMHVGKLLSAVKTHSEKLNLTLTPHTKKIKEREFKVVARSFNKLGIVVPYNKKSQLGYRDLAMQDKDLMTLLTKLEKAAPEQKSKLLSDLQPVLTYANIALDECDFGTGVKLGWELLYHGIDSLHSTISQFLANSYRLLNKEAFAKIAEAHMNHRKKGCDLSIV